MRDLNKNGNNGWNGILEHREDTIMERRIETCKIVRILEQWLRRLRVRNEINKIHFLKKHGAWSSGYLGKTGGVALEFAETGRRFVSLDAVFSPYPKILSTVSCRDMSFPVLSPPNNCFLSEAFAQSSFCSTHSHWLSLLWYYTKDAEKIITTRQRIGTFINSWSSISWLTNNAQQSVII